jgi:hypothetical protein
MTIKEFNTRLKALSLELEAKKVIEAKPNEYLDEQRDQLTAGFDSKGQRLESYKLYDYAIYKNKINALPGMWNPDLKLTGAFYNRMFISVNPTAVIANSTDDKSQMLTEKYGKLIWGLGNDALFEYRKNYFHNAFIKGLKQHLLHD